MDPFHWILTKDSLKERIWTLSLLIMIHKQNTCSHTSFRQNFRNIQIVNWNEIDKLFSLNFWKVSFHLKNLEESKINLISFNSIKSFFLAKPSQISFGFTFFWKIEFYLLPSSNRLVEDHFSMEIVLKEIVAERTLTPLLGQIFII